MATAGSAMAMQNIVKMHIFRVFMFYPILKQHYKDSWCYINFLQVGKLVLVPQLGTEEDSQALEQIQKALPHCEVVGIPALEAVREGGALNCISWNIAKN